MENTSGRTDTEIPTAKKLKVAKRTLIEPQVEIAAKEAGGVAEEMRSRASRAIEANQLQEGQASVGKNPKTYLKILTSKTTSLLKQAKLLLAK